MSNKTIECTANDIDGILTLYIWYLPFIIFRAILHIIIQYVVTFFCQ